MPATERRRGRRGRRRFCSLFVTAFLLAHLPVRAADLPLVDLPGDSDFVLASAGRTARICVEDAQAPAVRRAANDLAQDLARVVGGKPQAIVAPGQARNDLVLIEVLGKSAILDAWVKAGKLDVTGIAGQWESAVVQVVANPWPGCAQRWLSPGSDQRGAIYGAYWISESIGLSPWYWWADVPPQRRASVALAGGVHKLGPPAVKYRGIFLNDEDWGLRPWASGTLDPKTGNIGPATYARVFELLLRLRANVLWPAMHPGTRAFNFFPENKTLADEYGVVMGSSHAEPMLRDNVDEWSRDGSGEFNYVTNSAAVLRYWEDRVRSNAHFENIYTVGMRGIHDGEMQGGGTIAEQADRLRRIIADQRNLLRRYVNPDPAQVPQMFCPYKEVLPIYEQDPQIVPDDVTSDVARRQLRLHRAFFERSRAAPCGRLRRVLPTFRTGASPTITSGSARPRRR